MWRQYEVYFTIFIYLVPKIDTQIHIEPLSKNVNLLGASQAYAM